MNARSEIALDQQHALTQAAERLADEFAETVGTETVQRLLDAAYDRLADSATVANFLPVLAERHAREQLRALLRGAGTGSDGEPLVT